MLGLGWALSGILGGMDGLFGSSAQQSRQQQAFMVDAGLWSQQQLAELMRPGSLIKVPPGTLTNIHPITGPIVHTCSFCGRQTKKPDLEYGCRGCGAQEWR